MSETALYTAAAIFYTISLELLVMFFMIVFQALPGKFFFFRKKDFAKIFVLISLFAGLAGGYICYLADGYFQFIQFWAAFFPALFLPFLLMGFASESKSEPERVILHMKPGSYTLDTRIIRTGTQFTAATYAFWKNKVVRFTGAVPLSPIGIRAYCSKDENGIYVCTGYEVTEPGKYSGKEKSEHFHRMILIFAAFFMPLPTTPMFLWYKRNGQGENPYMAMMVMCLILVVSGGCRKLFINGKNKMSKTHYYIFHIMYYLIILTCFVQMLMKIESIM